MLKNVIDEEIKLLNQDQRQAVLHSDGRALVLAGPGSGKTKVISVRVLKLLSENPDNNKKILTLSFNRNAAEEMKARSLKLSEKAQADGKKFSERTHFSTIHGFCYKIIRDFCKIKGKVPPRVISGEELEEEITFLYGEILGDHNAPVPIKRITTFLGCGEKGRTEQKLSEKDIVLYETIERELKKFEKENNLIDFGDMLIKADIILKNDKTGRYSNLFDYVQVDEAQDVSSLQLDIIYRISGKNLLMVADDDQSIYGFRGATPEILKAYVKDDENTKVYTLCRNYRSLSEITEKAVSFIKQNDTRFQKNIYSLKGKGGSIEILKYNTVEKQAEEITERVLADVSNGEKPCILYRTNISGLLLGTVLFFKAPDKNVSFYGEKVILSDFPAVYKLVSELNFSSYDALKKSGKLELILFSKELSGKNKMYKEIFKIVLDIIGKKSKNAGEFKKNIEDICAFMCKKDGAEPRDVQFSTIHSVKGLEYDTVYLVDCCEKIFPGQGSLSNERIDEERRLMYVAMTRAKKRLFLSFPEKIGGCETEKSRFIDEVI